MPAKTGTSTRRPWSANGKAACTKDAKASVHPGGSDLPVGFPAQRELA